MLGLANRIARMCYVWGFCEAGSSTYSLWVGARLAGGLSTSFSGSRNLTSLELRVAPPPRPKEEEFPIADRRSGWAKDYTWRQNWGDFEEPEKLGVELDSTWFDCRMVRVDFLLSSELLPVELGGSWLFPVELVVQGSVLGNDLRGIRGGRRIQISRLSRVLGRTLTWPKRARTFDGVVDSRREDSSTLGREDWRTGRKPLLYMRGRTQVFPSRGAGRS